MKSILEDLHNGFVYPAELIRSTDSEYRSVNEKICEGNDYFMAKLSDEDKKRFDELDQLYGRSSFMHGTASFIYGFRLAALIMTEVYNGNGPMTSNEEYHNS